MPAWALKLGAFAFVAMTMIGSMGYVSAHPHNPLAPLKPPLAARPEPSDAHEEPLEAAPAPSPLPTPVPTTPATPTPRSTAPASAAAAKPGGATARASGRVGVELTTPGATVARTPAPARTPAYAIAPSVRATSKPPLTRTHSS